MSICCIDINNESMLAEAPLDSTGWAVKCEWTDE